MHWENFCSKLDASNPEKLSNVRQDAKNYFQEFGVYPSSINYNQGAWYFLARGETEKKLVIYGKDEFFDKFTGIVTSINDKSTKICSLENDNCDVIRQVFPFTNPSTHKGKDITIGLGDRLGIASPGHIRSVVDKPVFPILAQQSIRELNLTGRTYRDVLSSACWAVFQEGYTKGFGADGDHLKTPEEVKMALDNDFTMITLDCSEHIDNKVASYTKKQIEEKYLEIELQERKYLESTYLNREIKLKDGSIICFEPDGFMEIVLVYLKAIKFASDIYNNAIKNCGRQIDFEMSIDETLTPTTPQAHYFVASELIARDLDIASLAPRFCGEFQKGIDYRGDIGQFTHEFDLHVKISQHFGYKLSIHSGSDKFSVFPIIGEKTNGVFHLKTAGTNWLEAVRVIAANKPSLYRKMHKFAIEHVNEAKKYYHISADPSNIPNIDNMNDHDLTLFLDKDDSRQILHITYGLILMENDKSGKNIFKDEIYSTLYEHEEDYYNALIKHINKHQELLRI
jgi:hypothetical protein